MSEQIKVTATISAFLSDTYAVREFEVAMREGRSLDAINVISISTLEMDDNSDSSWTRIGTAEITLTLLPNIDLREEQIKRLEAMLQSERAESQRKQTAILSEINKLKAIEFSA